MSIIILILALLGSQDTEFYIQDHLDEYGDLKQWQELSLDDVVVQTTLIIEADTIRIVLITEDV